MTALSLELDFEGEESQEGRQERDIESRFADDLGIPGLVKLLSVREVAKRLFVEEDTVTGWIRQKKMPAKKHGKFWKIRSTDLQLWESYNGKIPEEILGNENRDEDQQDERVKGIVNSIATFSAWEIGKNVISGTYRIPLEWGPRIENILRHFPQFEGVRNNLFRHAMFKSILEFEYVIRLKNDGTLDTAWALLDQNQQIHERNATMRRVISAIDKTKSMFKELKDREGWREFMGQQKEIIKDWPDKWKNQVMRVLCGKSRDQKHDGDGSFEKLNGELFGED